MDHNFYIINPHTFHHSNPYTRQPQCINNLQYPPRIKLCEDIQNMLGSNTFIRKYNYVAFKIFKTMNLILHNKQTAGLEVKIPKT